MKITQRKVYSTAFLDDWRENDEVKENWSEGLVATMTGAEMVANICQRWPSIDDYVKERLRFRYL
jgi:hypothetical protein